MGESLSHIRLVEQMSRWILHNCLNGDPGSMMIDHPASDARMRPPKIGGFVPDVYVPSTGRNSLIIAEAKTARDLETRHSLNQLDAFVSICSQVEDAMFILAVPWDLVRLAESIIRQVRNRHPEGEGKLIARVLERLSG